MEFKSTSIVGCYVIQPKLVHDERGRFVKTFRKDIFSQQSVETIFFEDVYSISKKGVLRGLHFQIPPYETVRLAYCIDGSVFDAVVDLRKQSPTYGQYETFELSADNGNMLYIPIGLAHGFYVLSERAIMGYKISSPYSFEHDAGIVWNSVGIPWPVDNPIMSSRDRKFLDFDEFNSPFK